MLLALVHLRDLRCTECAQILALAGARSFVVDPAGDPSVFPEEQPPSGFEVDMYCAQGHATTLFVPNEIAAEDVELTPEDAPVGCDAVLSI